MLARLARRGALLSLLLFLGAGSARAATINISPTDSYAKIESAKAGDQVVIAPGTYKYRVFLTQQAPANNPIVIRALDPTNPPVWDLSGDLVENAPGSYTAGDGGRGCWQFSGATNVHVSGLVITGCHNDTANSSGVRYYNGASGIQLSDIVFRNNDNGLTGGSQDSDLTVEFCEFDSNGTLLAPASAPSHNIYIYGGTFTLRYSYVHDSIQGQNFHVRAHHALLEYNWFARAKSYEGDLMTDGDYDGSGTLTQQMIFRGNVLFQGTTQQNGGQIIALFNDSGVSGLTLDVTLAYNTFVGRTSGHAALVHLSNADGTTMSAELDDNLIAGASAATLIEDTDNGHVTGTHNWMSTDTAASGLTGTVFGADPMFRDAAAQDFALATGSTAIGAASSVASSLVPVAEYFRNETVTRMYRLRASAHDIGAFESTTSGGGIGPYGSAETPTGGTPGAGGALGGNPGSGGFRTGGNSGIDNGDTGGRASAGAGGSARGGAGGDSGGGGCSCAIGGGPAPRLFTSLLMAAWLLRRRRAR